MSTHKPASREEFKDFCLRRLGAPLLEINVHDDQVEDCIEIALQYYHDYHYDGTQKTYLAHQVTQTDIDNKYLSIPEAIIGVINIFDIGDSYSTNNLFNLRYQISLNDLYSFNTGPFAPYYMTFQNVALAEELFVGKQSLDSIVTQIDCTSIWTGRLKSKSVNTSSLKAISCLIQTHIQTFTTIDG